jgi:MerR family transcriptional regulator, light-induced transcriptional regulator
MNPVTLRAWERRYDLLRPVRTESGRRMYTQQHIDLLHRVRGMLDRGMSIAQAADSLRSLDRANDRRPNRWEALRRGMVAAVARFDEPALEELYNEALAAHPLDQVTRHLLMPLLVELGDRWESADISIAEEHFFSLYVRNKIGARLHHRTPLDSGFKLLCTCAPGEQHEIGLMLFALAAHSAGMRTVLLGANAPLEDLPTACRRAVCDAIVVSSSCEPAGASFFESLESLVRRANRPVFVGGAGSVRHRDQIAAAGAVALGADIAIGVRRLVAALTGAIAR